MEIYRTNNRNIFYTITKIDNKKIELDFILTVKDHFHCDIFIQNKQNLKDQTYTTIQQYNFKKHDFVISKMNFNKYLTNRQIELLKNKIKKAYLDILKIKYDDIFENDSSFFNNNLIDEYENYRKYIDCM